MPSAYAECYNKGLIRVACRLFLTPDRTCPVHVLRRGCVVLFFFFPFLTGVVPFADNGFPLSAFPLYVRDVGMSYATAVTWLFSKFLSPDRFRAIATADAALSRRLHRGPHLPAPAHGLQAARSLWLVCGL